MGDVYHMTIDAGLLALRLIIGLVVAAHGAQKLFGFSGGPGFTKTIKFTENLGFRPAPLWAALAGGGEFFGGLGLALGLLMPLPAVAIVAAMGVVVFRAHWKNGFWGTKGGLEYGLVLGLVAAVLGLINPGKYSLDALFGLHLPTAPVFWVGTLLALVSIVVSLTVGARSSRTGAAGQRAA